MLYSYVGIDLAWKSGAIVVLDQDWKIKQVIIPQFDINKRKYVWNKIDNKLPALKHWKKAIEEIPKSSLRQTTYYVELMENNKLFNYIAGYVSGVIAQWDNSPFTKLELISPNKWNRELLWGKVQREQIKKASLNHFKQQEPSWYERYKDHPNLSDIADSYCIAYFGIKNSLRKNFYENQERHRKPTKNNRNQNTIKETKQRPTRQVKRVQRNS